MIEGAAPPAQPVQYAIVEVPAKGNIVETDVITQLLVWIGFNMDAQRQCIKGKAFGTFNDVRATNEAGIDAIVKDLKRTKLLKGFAHWVEDFYRTLETFYIERFTTATFFDWPGYKLCYWRSS